MCSQAFLGQPLKGNSIPPTITPEMVHVSELVATVAVMYNWGESWLLQRWWPWCWTEHGNIVNLTLPVAEEPWWTTQGNSSQPSKVILSIEALEPVGCFETVLQDYNEDQWVKGKLTAVLDWNVPSICHRDQRKSGKETKHFLKITMYPHSISSRSVSWL